MSFLKDLKEYNEKYLVVSKTGFGEGSYYIWKGVKGDQLAMKLTEESLKKDMLKKITPYIKQLINKIKQEEIKAHFIDFQSWPLIFTDQIIKITSSKDNVSLAAEGIRFTTSYQQVDPSPIKLKNKKYNILQVVVGTGSIERKTFNKKIFVVIE